MVRYSVSKDFQSVPRVRYFVGDFMPKKVFKSDMSVKELDSLIRELQKYNDDLPNKFKKLVSELLQKGVDVSKARISDSPLGKYVTVTTNISSEKMGCKGILLAKGAVKEQDGYAPFSILLAIEFGSGIHYNPTPNPLSAEMGYGVGTFPGQVHAFQSEGWMYWDEKAQEWRHTYGVKATMPLYNADIEIIQNVIRIAKEVFR